MKVYALLSFSLLQATFWTSGSVSEVSLKCFLLSSSSKLGVFHLLRKEEGRLIYLAQRNSLARSNLITHNSLSLPLPILGAVTLARRIKSLPMDKIPIIRSRVPKDKRQQAPSSGQVSTAPMNPNPLYDDRWAALDDTTDEEEVAQSQDHSLPDDDIKKTAAKSNAFSETMSAETQPSTLPRSKGAGEDRQTMAPKLTGHEVMAEWARRLEAAEKKRKRVGLDEESTSEHTEQTERDTALVYCDSADIKAPGLTEPTSSVELKRNMNRSLKTGLAGEPEAILYPYKKARLTTHQDYVPTSITSIPTDPSIKSSNQRNEKGVPCTSSRILTVYELAAIEEARTHQGLQVCAVRRQYAAALQRIQERSGKSQKHLFALSSSEKRMLQKHRKQKNTPIESQHPSPAIRSGSVMQQEHIGKEEQHLAGQRAPERDEDVTIDINNPRAKSANTEVLETACDPTDPLHVAPGNSPDVQDDEAADKLEWVSGSEEGEISAFSYRVWGWTRW